MRLALFFVLMCLPIPAIPAAGDESRHVPPVGPSSLGPHHVVVIYNTRAAGSREVAEAYAAARGISQRRLVGLECPHQTTITREEFNTTIRDPLRERFRQEGWWQEVRTPGGIEAQAPEIRVLATVFGMPLRISRDAEAAEGKEGAEAKNEASVDSELSLLGVFHAGIDAGLNNPYFRQKQDFARFRPVSIFAVSRIDAHDKETALQLATAGVRAERAGGPWGRAMIDLSGTYPDGDNWLRDIFQRSWRLGIPAQIDRHEWSFTDRYPVRDVALYFGWYDRHVSGFAADPEFQFRTGAIAVHIHSYSATTLQDPNQNWTAPLIARGAAASLGNVYEPFLQTSHNLDMFFEALAEGYTLVEASMMSMPVLSWMTVCIGDPLYRPFAGRRDFSGAAFRRSGHEDYKAAAVVLARNEDDPRAAAAALRDAAGRGGNLFHEFAGLMEYREGRYRQAQRDFERTWAGYEEPLDQIRAGLLVGEAHLARERKTQALVHLRMLLEWNEEDRHAVAVRELIDRLDPPPPPPPEGGG